MLIPYNEFAGLFKKAGFEVTEGQYNLFERYAALLLEKNAVMNLTAIVEPGEIAVKHFLDSVLPLKFFEIPECAALVDVGAGAGFPSVPMAIIRPNIRPTMIDSLKKRVNFLEELTASLGIEARCLHLRAEEAGQGELREGFDVCAARAVSRLPVLCEYCLPLVKTGGVFLAMKGGNCAEEIKSAYTAIKTLGGKLEDVVEYSLPTGDGRTLVVIRKVSPTPARYPRRQAKIAEKPL